MFSSLSDFCLRQWQHLRSMTLSSRGRRTLVSLTGLFVMAATLLTTLGMHEFRVFASCSGSSYTVRYGDTLGSIAARYGASISSLAQANGIGNVNVIYAGQSLCIPGTSSVGSTSQGTNYVSIAQQDAKAAGISPTLFVRQIYQESGFNPNARSWAGAIGIAQFMPDTATLLDVNPHDPVQSLRAAAFLMASYYQRYGDYSKALAAYNAGPGTVDTAVYDSRINGTNWLSSMPEETRNYIQIIMG